MKNLSLILNAVLLIAVIFLYVKVYSNDKEVAVPLSNKAAASNIVFVNSDTLMDNYALFKTMSDKIEKKRDSLDRLMTDRGRALQKDIEQYQQEGASMTPQQRESKEAILSHRQEEYVSTRDKMLEQLKVEENEMTDSIHQDLIAYLNKYNKTKGFDFILGYSRGGGILLANDSLDITKVILEGLNRK